MSRILAGTLLCVLLPLAGVAQETPVEFGIDGGVSIFMPDDDDGDNLTVIGIPNSYLTGITGIRFGFFVSPRVSVEPTFSFMRMSDGDYSATLIDLFPSFLFHFKDFDRVSLPYVRLGAGLSHRRSENGDSESNTQFALGGGLGVKVPFSEVAFLRLEAGYEKRLERGDIEDYQDFMPGYGILRFSVGISAILN